MSGEDGVLVPTPHGPGRLTTRGEGSPRGLLVLGHGAGGLSWSVDVLAAAEAAVGLGWRAVLVDQPWRVAGRKVASPPATLDGGWVPLVDAARGVVDPSVPLVVGGRSAGARVACRTAAALGARAVLALSFPLHPPGRPQSSRAAELAVAATLPVRVVQGERDPFGTPAEVRAALAALRSDLPEGGVVAVPGTHSFRPGDAAAVGEATEAFLRSVVAG